MMWKGQAAEAVKHIHSKRVIHGSIGAHNFFVRWDGALVLADFGGSRIDGSTCLVSNYSRYTGPGALDPVEKDDLFALGTVLYEISTGEELYSGKTRNEIQELFRKQEFPDLAPIAASVHVAIEKCWHGQYNSAGEVLCDLRKSKCVFITLKRLTIICIPQEPMSTC